MQSDLNLKRYQIVETTYSKFEKIITANKQEDINLLYDDVGKKLVAVNTKNTFCIITKEYFRGYCNIIDLSNVYGL